MQRFSIEELNECMQIVNSHFEIGRTKKNSRRTINSISQELEIELTEIEIRFLQILDGRCPKHLLAFISKRKIPVMSDIQNCSFGFFYELSEISNTLASYRDILPPMSIPFCEATPGDIVSWSFHTHKFGSIFFNSHESNKKPILIANNMCEFISSLHEIPEPETTESVLHEDDEWSDDF